LLQAAEGQQGEAAADVERPVRVAVPAAKLGLIRYRRSRDSSFPEKPANLPRFIVVRCPMIAQRQDWKHVAARGLGWLTTARYRLRPRIRIGPRLLGNGRLRIAGPGRVVLEADVNAWSHAEVNRLITTSPQALIHIGRNARLNGCTIVAAEHVEVGADSVLGSCEVRDHLPYSEAPAERRRPAPPKPVVIEANVWIGGQVSVLPGVRIGRDSVVGIHSVVFEDIPPGVIVGGNPARVLRRLEPRSAGG
jgi:maltose O-acetyltransferase